MNKEIIEEYNDKLSHVYGKATKEEFDWLAPSKVTNALLPLIKKDDRILDLGCGTGQSAERFIENGCRVIGVDISAEMLSLARRYKFYELHKYDISKGLKGLRLQSNSFNAVMAVGIMEFITNFNELIGEISDLLVPEGYIAFTYEPVVENSKLQYKKVSMLGEDIVDPVPELLSFKVYRHSEAEVRDILLKNKIAVICHEKFIGYYKTKDKIPIYYEMIIGRKI